MNVLFLTIGQMNEIDEPGLYSDLLRQFRNHGHNVYVVAPAERREGADTSIDRSNGSVVLTVRIGNITKCNLVEKGISTLLIETQYKSAIKKYFRDVKFDLVMYSTPPITLSGVVNFIRKRDEAKTYLVLKDIFPQNAVDIGMLRKTGAKGLIYKYFREKEKNLYALSDNIGCMSQANVDYVINNNPEVDPKIVEICPNSAEIVDMRVDYSIKKGMRDKYGIPHDKVVFVYGGNLGRPQGIPFLLRCLESQKDNKNVFFLIVGDGTEYGVLEAYFNECKPKNMKLMKRLPKEDYDRMVAACDVGMIFLDHRFTIPNFPSRLLAYMQAGIPVLACTDPNTDIGSVIVDGGFGWWCESNDVNSFSKLVDTACSRNLKALGDIGFEYMNRVYNVKSCYEIIMKHM